MGDDVGGVDITWVGGIPKITVFTDDGEHYLSEVHIWVGCQPLPTRGPKCKAAPGQLGCTYEFENTTEFTITDCEGDLPCDGQVWIAIHAVTCDLICPGEDQENDGFIDNSDLPAVSHTNLSEVKKLDVRPNPAKDQIEVLFETELEEKAVIRIFDLNGKLVKSEIYQTQVGQNTMQLDIDELSGGLYWISAQFESKIMNARFVVSGK